MDTESRVNGNVRMAESTTKEAYGASQIGPFALKSSSRHPTQPPSAAGTAAPAEGRP